ncbi:MAG TPA: hypothetical protein VFT27_06230 [Actinomycetota bacterium]|nr:hypothetical protein [Actinomycetota bacterium]
MAYAATTRTNGAIRTTYALLAIVGVLFLVAQLTLFSVQRAPSWDEALYLSQVDPQIAAMRFSASRARGIVLLIAPLSVAGAGLGAIRIYLAIAASAMLTIAYACWAHLLRSIAALAAALFATTWVGLFYGGEVMPNLWSALLVTAALGTALRPSKTGRSLVAAGLLAAAALVRPLDAVVAAIVIAAILGHRGDRRGSVSAIGGCLVGVLPWVAEMSVRFGGPIGAITAATEVARVRIGVWENVVRHLEMRDAPASGTVAQLSPAVTGVVWWLALGVVCTVAAVAPASGMRRATARAAIATGLALSTPYLFAVAGAAPRFLLPAYAVLAIPSAIGLGTIWSRSRSLAPVLVAAAVLWVGWNVHVADRVEAAVARNRSTSAQVGRALRTAVGEDACALVSSENFAQIAFASRCEGLPLDADRGFTWLAAHGQDGARFVLLRGDQTPRASWGLRYLMSLDPDWRVYALD